MKNARPQTSETSAGTAKFYVENPREIRLLSALFKRPSISCHDLREIVGAQNVPDLVMRVRLKFSLDIPMDHRDFTDRDGATTRPGWYSLSDTDRPRVAASLRGC